MAIPPFVVALRKLVGTDELWLPAVTAVVLRGDELLLTKRVDNGQWAPVTGLIDPGEEPAVAARREAMEEAGVEITVDRLASVSVSPQIAHTNGDLGIYLDLTFACTWVGGEARVADDENTDMRWWPLDALPEMSPFLVARIQAGLSGETTTRFIS